MTMLNCNEELQPVVSWFMELPDCMTYAIEDVEGKRVRLVYTENPIKSLSKTIDEIRRNHYEFSTSDTRSNLSLKILETGNASKLKTYDYKVEYEREGWEVLCANTSMPTVYRLRLSLEKNTEQLWIELIGTDQSIVVVGKFSRYAEMDDWLSRTYTKHKDIAYVIKHKSCTI